MKVKDLMTSPVVACRDTDSLHVAAHLMWQHDCGAVPVIDASGKIVGMVTDRDICMATYTQGKPPQQIPVSTAMARKVYTAAATDSVESVERTMSEAQIRRVPVVDAEQRPIGIVSLNDLARRAAETRDHRLFERSVAQVLAAVGSRHSGRSHWKPTRAARSNAA